MICICAIISGKAQNKSEDFNEHFCDSTLRIDYIFSGNAQSQQISLDK